MNKHFFPLCFLLFIPCFAFGQAPTGFSGTGYRTTVHLKWDGYTTFEPAGYNIYRHTVGSNYGAPVRRIGAYEDYTDYNLEPGTQYFYKVSAFDASGNESLLSDETVVSTNNNSYLKVASLDVLVPIYTGSMTPSAPDEIMLDLEVARQFFFRNTFGQLNLKYHFWIIPGYPLFNENGLADFGTIETDLKSKGILDNQYDAVYIMAHQLYGFYGGAWWFGQTAGSMGYDWTHWDALDHYTQGNAWLFTHEFGHALDLIIANGSGYPEMLSNHYYTNYPLPPDIPVFDAGDGFDGMATILRLFNHHLDYAAPWDGYFEVLDNDGDGLANNDARLTMDEARFGSNPAAADTDSDGLNDLQEFYAGTFSSANPNNPDTDNDGLNDGTDTYPVSNFAPENPKTTTLISIDGILGAGEGWHSMVSKPFFSNVPGATLSTFTTWDDNNFYFAFQSNQPLKYFLQMDGSGEDGMNQSDIRFPNGDYTSVNENSLSDSYHVLSELVIRSDGSQVYLKDMPVPGSQVSTTLTGGIYTTEVRLPHNIGPGEGYVYTPPGSPVVTIQSYHQDDIIGIGLIALPLSESNGNTAFEWGGYYVSKHVILMNDYLHNYDMELTGSVSNNYCTSTSNFPWEDWIAKVKIGAIDNPSGKSPYSDFTGISTNLETGSTPIELTTGFSYFTWDEYWRVWIDLNHDGDYTDAGETVFEGIKTKPVNGTPSATLYGSLNIPATAMTGSARMRVSMKRGAYATPCETLAFGEVEDYSVNINTTAPKPDLISVAWEVIHGGGSYCYAIPGSPFGYFGGLVRNPSQIAVTTPFTAKAWLSKDEVISSDDILWQTLNYTGIGADAVASLNIDAPVPPSTPQGIYYGLVKVDPDNVVPESDETNNIFTSGELRIGTPDFVLQNLAGVSASLPVEGNLNFSVQVKDMTGFPLDELDESMGISAALSENNLYGGFDDVSLISKTVSLSQFANGIATVNVSVQLPPSVTPGDYYLVLRANAYCDANNLNNDLVGPLVTVTTGGGTPVTYCGSYSNFPWEDWIGRVKINDLDNPSGKSTYSDFTDKTAHLKQGLQYSITLTTAYSYFTFDEYWKIWVDFDHDGVFTYDEEVFSGILQRPDNGTANASLTKTLSMPSISLTGTTRMRVSMKRDDWPMPCETLPFGEVEDYTVEIQPAPSNLPNLFPSYVDVPTTGFAGESLSGEFAILNNGTVDVSGDYSVGWYFSYDNSLDSEDDLIGSAALNNTPLGVTPKMPFTMTVPVWAEPGTYYVFMVADKDDQVAEINEYDNLFSFGFTIPNAEGDYCASVSEFPWHEWISEVNINGLEVASGKSTYSDFTGTTFTLQKNSSDNSVKFTGTFSYFTYREYWESWVDFNHNGVFESWERLFDGDQFDIPPNGLNVTQSISGKVGPFPNALTGPTRMRVSMKRYTAASPCETLPFGEVEDYTVNIVEDLDGGDVGNRAASIVFEAVPEMTWVNLSGACHSAEPIVQIAVEKSMDGLNYELLESMPGKATADNSQVVQTRDTKLAEGFNYYRMGVLLKNGEVVYSPVRIVFYMPPAEFTPFPNPATDFVHVNLEKLLGKPVQIKLINLQGILVKNLVLDELETQVVDIPLDNLPSGHYFLWIHSPGRRAVSKALRVERDF